MSVSDNFDYSIPTLKRNNTMYLSCINSQDAKMRPFKKLYTQRDWSTNLYNLDIESSMPRTFGIFTNKIDFINKVDDIEKSSPKILHFPLNKPEYNLSNKDIEKSTPISKQFKSTRNTNPLQPKYKLSKLEDYPPEVPRFIRDSIDISDIKGASPSKRNNLKIKDNLTEKVVENAKRKVIYDPRKNFGKIKYHYIDYSNLNTEVFKSKRNTNALDPIYIFRNKEGGKMYYFGPIEKSKPQVQYPYYYKPPLNLKLDDIKGNNPGSKNFINQFNGKNFELCIADIEKSGPGSLKKGIITKRCINPLMPKYQYLGEKELKESFYYINKLNNRSDSMPKIKGIKQENNNIKIISNETSLNIDNKNSENKINNNECSKKMKKSNSAINIPSRTNKYNIVDNKEKEKDKDKLDKIPLLGNNSENGINNNIFKFDKTKYGKRPSPFYGFSHDPFLQSSENKDHLNEIEKKKQEKELKNIYFSRNMRENNKNYIANEYIKNPNEKKLLFMSDNDVYLTQNRFKENGATFMKRSNSRKNQFSPPQKSYEEQLYSFINNNNIQS